ncbi:MAG: hypothetical protein LR008_01410 [Candidatus Pacebacteria bacterium]|nr:hypothetical protein [Candidatus Paceibacterota bacterium]
MKVRLRHNSSRKKTTQVIIISVIVITVGMMIPKAISIVAATVMLPVHATNIWLESSSSLIPSFVRDRQSLEAEIKSLNNELIVSKSSSLTQQRMIDENNRLRHLLSVDGEARVAASVVARPDELPYDFLQIDRGSDHGIEVGSPVFVGPDIVIGLVVHTAAAYSFVEMITTAGFEATSFISGPNVVAVLEGLGGGVARVRVPQGIPLSVGNLVYLPSIEPGVFGRISRVENEPTQPEQYGYISPDIAISGLFQVSVGKLSQISHSATEIDEQVIRIMNSNLLIEPDVIDYEATSTDKEVVTDES